MLSSKAPINCTCCRTPWPQSAASANSRAPSCVRSAKPVHEWWAVRSGNQEVPHGAASCSWSGRQRWSTRTCASAAQQKAGLPHLRRCPCAPT